MITLGASANVREDDAMLKKLLARMLYGGSNRLRSYEQQIIDEVLKQVRPEVRSTLVRQLGKFDCIQHWSGDRIVKFGMLDPAEGTGVPHFTNVSKDLYWARIELKDASGSVIKCDLTAHAGLLATMEFSASPKSLKNGPVTVSRVTLNADLAAASTPPRGADVETEAQATALLGIPDLNDVVSAVGTEGIQSFESRLGAAIPTDLRRLLQICDGFSSRGWVFNGSRAWRYPTSTRDYWVLAEEQDGPRALVLGIGDQGVEAFLFDKEDTDLVREEETILTALRRLVAGSLVDETSAD